MDGSGERLIDPSFAASPTVILISKCVSSQAWPDLETDPPMGEFEIDYLYTPPSQKIIGLIPLRLRL